MMCCLSGFVALSFMEGCAAECAKTMRYLICDAL